MKLFETIRNLFGKKRELTVAEILALADAQKNIETIGNRTFQVLYLVADADNSFRTVADGFETKQACKAYCKTLAINYFIVPYTVEL